MIGLNSVQPEVTVAVEEDIGGAASVTGRINFDEGEVTGLLLDFVDVAENNGLKLPREFGLLVKQSLYFDRYLKILAPNLDVMNDARISLDGSADNSGAGGLPPSEVL